MQKSCVISCCAECPAYKERDGKTPYCEREGLRIKAGSGDLVNPAVIGFPEWCPLDSVEILATVNYKKAVKKIMDIMSDESNPEALLEASHYLNSVVDDAKKKTGIGGE
jgi:hypothetical protein